MPDIGMCSDDRCPARGICYRYSAVPNKPQQNYGGHVMRDPGAKKCPSYWPNCQATSSLMPEAECHEGHAVRQMYPCSCEIKLMEKPL